MVLGMLVGFSIIFHLYRKERGYLHSTVGYITLEGVNPAITSSLYLYPDKITINDVQIIPIKRVLKASSYETSKALNRTTPLKRYIYYLTIEFIDKEGKIKSIKCYSKINQRGAYMSYLEIERKINKLIGYVPPTSYPDKPYEL